MIQNSIGPSYALFVLQALDELGLNDDQYFANTPLDRQRLCLGQDIAMNDFVQLLLNARQSPKGEQLGLLIGQRANMFVLGEVGNAAAAAPTLREGFQALESFTRLHATYIRIEVNSNLAGIAIGIKFLNSLRDTERFHLESAILLFQQYVEMLTGTPLTNAAYRVPYAKPDYAQQYSSLFHSPIYFNSPQMTIELPRETLDQPSPFHNQYLWKQSQYKLAQSIEALRSQDQAPYTQHLLALLNTREPPLPRLAQIADQLQVSERTLNRRLMNEGTSYRQLKSAITHQWATSYLEHSNLSVESIAALLDYQDTANFRRAFRKQQGCSPQNFRAGKLTEKSPTAVF